MAEDPAPSNEPLPVVDDLALADDDFDMFADATVPEPGALEPTELQNLISEKLDENEEKPIALKVKTSVKKEVAAAISLSVDEFDRHFVKCTTEVGRQFKNVWDEYEKCNLQKLDAKAKGTRGQALDTIRAYLKKKRPGHLRVPVRTGRRQEHVEREDMGGIPHVLVDGDTLPQKGGYAEASRL
jgi:hypothetical protein